MKMKKWTALLLCLALLLSMTGCAKEEEAEPVQTRPIQTTVATEPPAPEADELYAAAIAGVENATDLTLRISRESTIEAGEETFLETTNQTITMTGRGSDSAKVMVSTYVSYADAYVVTYQDVCTDGKAYSLVDGTYRFACSADAQRFEERLTPAVLLDAALYGSLTAEKAAGGTQITFGEPTAAESWALPEGAELIDASGTAVVKGDGSLRKSTYTLSYTYGGARITDSYSVAAEPEAGEILVPADAADYVMLDSLEAVRMSERVCGYLMQSSAISSTISETMTSLAAGVVRTESSTIRTSAAEELTASYTIDVSLASLTSGESDTYHQEETFKNGTYTFQENDEDPQPNTEVDAQSFWEYCGDGYLTTLVAFDYWENATVKDLGDLYLVECTFTEEMAEALYGDVCQTLFDDADFLKDYSTAYATTNMTGYFSVDKYTGMPIAAAYHYAGSDVIDEQSYAIGLQSIQSYTLPDTAAAYNLTGEMPAEEEPETKASPLFYHVTGDNGQEMWLLGTIHVGDARTAYLPQEIYDALEASAALAVEVDVIEFEKKLQSDQKLLSVVAENYYYTDGSTVVDHADPELLTEAETYMKATGNYSSNLTMMKPAVWANMLENTYLRLGYALSANKGVDRRLIMLANENNKMVMEVESGEDQIKLLTGYSDELQELLLETAISYEPNELWQETAKLYEMWCRGDEAELISYLNDPSDEEELSDEEKALMEEYNNAMIVTRNDAMLQEAIEYLETEHTFFFAVGLAHLLQDNGLVDGLRDAGYTVELVSFN